MKGDQDEKKDVMAHINEHVSYPASRDDIVKACEEMSDVPKEEKEWLEEKLPDETFFNAQEVKTALGF